MPTRAACVLAAIAVFVAATPLAAGAEMRKPTAQTDAEGATQQDAAAHDFDRVFNGNTSAYTNAPGEDASITWTDWDAAGTGVYEDLSVSVTANASGFTTDQWGFFVDNTTGTVCDSTDHAIRPLGIGGPSSPTNFTLRLPRTTELSRLEVCLVGTVALDAGQAVSTVDIRTNATLDTTPPLWQNLAQNDSTPVQGDAVELAAQGFDSLNLSHATLSTNETGAWENKTAYGSPRTVYVGGEAVWTNVSWSNVSVDAGTTVGWRVWYNDTAGNHNATDVETFTLEDAFLAVTLANPPAPLAVVQDTTFLLNATVDCMGGDCGNVTGTARYNQSGDPDTPIDQFTGTPFHTTQKENPASCATFLRRGERCNVTWHVNATGPVGSIHSVDVNLTSNRTAWNATDPQNVELVAAAIELVLRFAAVDFGSLFVGTAGNPAENNSDSAYNISITGSSGSDADIWLNGTDMLQEDGTRRIGVSNASWNATENDPGHTAPLRNTPTRIASGVPPGTNVTTFYWLDVPFGLYHDNYTGTLTVTANETQ